MAKVLLVEDDNNLREIFEMRLKAEGYETLAASDGEQALVVALKEKPDLIIADVMMPRLSGFEMIETLRAAPNTGNIKVVMMTALGQAEDRARGEKLGVVKYLVKSQVTLEDFVRVVREVLQPDKTSKSSAQASQASNNKQESEGVMQDDTSPANQSTPNTPAGGPADDSTTNTNPISDAGASSSDAGGQMSSAQQQNAMQDQINTFVDSSPPTGGSDSGTMPPAGTPASPGGDTTTPGSDSGSSTSAPDIPVTPAPDQGSSGDSGTPTPSAPGTPSPSQ